MKLIHPFSLASLALLQPLVAQAPQAFENPVVLRAGELLPAEVMQGPNHRVRDMVTTDGYLAHFEIDTDFGIFLAAGVAQAKTRIAETEALAKLAAVSKSDLFAEGLKRSIEQPIDAVKNIVTRPVDSLKKAPSTVGHFFSKVGSSIERGANKLKDNHETGQTPSGKDIGNTAGKIVGFDKARLDTAKQLGVDPYSDNARLQEEMDKVTWAFFAGGLPLRIGAAVASAGVAVVATKMVGIPEEIYALTQSELALRDQQSLTAMGVAEADVAAFQIHPALSTTRRHRIVKSLEALPAAQGRERVIQLANACETPGQADFLVAALALLADRQSQGAADYKELLVHGRLPAAATADGVIDVPAPVDHVTWTEQVAAFAQRDDLGQGPKRLIHTGRLSDATNAGFQANGWQTVPVGAPSF
jgi:hypothetical protein